MSTINRPARPAIELGGVTPILRVKDIAASVEYYVGKLGFKVNWGFPDPQKSFFASISRGKTTLFLSAGDQGHVGSWVWIDGIDVDALHEEFKASGVTIRNPPTNYPWALEMQVEDPDGNVLRFGSDPRKGEPEGAWLDMNGDRWARLPEGGYKKSEE